MGEPSDGAQGRPEMERAEELVDMAAETVAGWTTAAGVWILKQAALAREEAEDIWAEAQSLRRGEGS